MGEFIVNGEIVDVRESTPTAADLKRNAGSLPSDWVMATMPNGKVLQLQDHEPLPAQVENYAIVPPFTYGRVNRAI